nr:hypothetical protein [Thiorhodovibrio winogradskyi]
MVSRPCLNIEVGGDGDEASNLWQTLGEEPGNDAATAVADQGELLNVLLGHDLAQGRGHGGDDGF